jgi:ribosomal protein S18 acetylase RimI-like enzyme
LNSIQDATNDAISTRPAEAGDESFLYRLYASTRSREWATLALPEEEKEALMRMQFDAQASSYRTQFPASEHSVILSFGTPAGRIWTDESAREIKVLDVSVLPEFQSRGLGTHVMKASVERARNAKKPLRHSVLKWNSRAISFYLGLGFVPCGGDDFFLQLERLP